jgi:hypothetical protein
LAAGAATQLVVDGVIRDARLNDAQTTQGKHLFVLNLPLLTQTSDLSCLAEAS